jgi:hypothetical protein
MDALGHGEFCHQIVEGSDQLLAVGHHQCDRMKTEAGDVTLIAVGGGAFLVPDRLAGISEVVRVPHGDCANAVGAATAQISGETDQVYRDLSRADAIAAAEARLFLRAIKKKGGVWPSLIASTCGL